MRTVCIIQARLGSTRLPGKCLMDVAGRPLISHVLERATLIHGLDAIVLNVPAADEAEFRKALIDPWDKYVIHGVKDQEADVLGSFLQIAEWQQADAVMRLTGDCVLLDPELCTQVLDIYKALDHWRDGSVLRYMANDTLRSGFPDGTDCEVVSFTALQWAAHQAITPYDREHVMPWIRRRGKSYTITAPFGEDHSNFKWSVDTEHDLARARAIYAHLKPGAFSWRDTLAAELEAT